MTGRHVALMFVLAVAVVPASAGAQLSRAGGRRTPVVKVAKWTLLATAVSLGAFALRRSTDAADAYDGLRALCLDAPARCDHEGEGYPDPHAETLYDRAIRADRQAQMGIYGGEAALLGSVAMFILDLRGERNPPTIPYPRPPAAAARGLVLVTVEF